MGSCKKPVCSEAGIIAVGGKPKACVDEESGRECVIMNKALVELIRISNVTGKDSTLVQGGGGNTSVKTADGRYMYIKSSGTALKDMNERTGWRRLRLGSVLPIIKDKSIAQLDTQAREIEVANRLLLSCDDKVASGARPSVESHLHAFLDKCVIHLHPNAVGAYVNAKNGKAEIEKLFKDEEFPLVWVLYADPGFMLAKRIAKAVVHYQNRFGKKPEILFLEKHGLLVSAKSPNTALQLVRKVIKRCNSKLRQPKNRKIKSVSQKIVTDTKLCIRRAFFEATGQYATISYFYNDTIAAFWRQRDAEKMLSSAVLTPDELLYANGPAMWVGPPRRKKSRLGTPVDKCDSKKIAARLTLQKKKGRKPSVAFLVKGIGLFVAGKDKVAAIVRDIVASSLFIRANAHRMGGILGLSKRQQEFINQWEAEAFRKKLASVFKRR